MRSNPYRPPSKHFQAPPVRQAPLGDDRFKELVSRASAFFATAERDVEAEKAATITEIKVLMDQYGITIEMLQME